MDAIPITKWLARCKNLDSRWLAILRVAEDLIAGLNISHSAGNYVSGIAEETIFVRLDDGKAFVDKNRSNVTTKNFQGVGDESLVDRSIYMAPELSGVLQAPIEASADLYSVGVLLYRSISGLNPIPAISVSELLLGQMT